jgi:hypothetical protein
MQKSSARSAPYAENFNYIAYRGGVLAWDSEPPKRNGWGPLSRGKDARQPCGQTGGRYEFKNYTVSQIQRQRHNRKATTARSRNAGPAAAKSTAHPARRALKLWRGSPIRRLAFPGGGRLALVSGA